MLTFRPGDHQLQLVKVFFGQAEVFQRDDALLPVENTQHDVLAVDRRLAGNAEIDGTTGNAEADAAILRRAHFSDIHPGKYLDTHGHRRPVGFMQGANLAQHAIDAIANT